MFERDGRVPRNSIREKASRRINASAGIREQELFDLAIKDVSGLLCFRMKGKYTKGDLAALLVDAGSREVSINQSSKDLDEIMVESNARYHLGKLRLWKLEDQINDLLLTRAKVILPTKALKIGGDVVDIPYHGQPMKRNNEIRKGKAKSGTNTFHVYASLYVILYGRRVTLCVKYARANEPLAEILKEMVERISEEGIGIDCLFLDRGFYSIPVINTLKSMNLSFCIMAPIKGKKGGLKRLCKGPSRRENYTMVSRKDGVVIKTSYKAYVICKYEKGRHGKHKRNYYIYATYKCPIPLQRIFDEYRKRFGIESSYRQMNDGRARTSTRDPIRRLLFVAIGFVLLNLWVFLKWQRISIPRRGPGGRIIYEELFSLETMFIMLSTAIGTAYCRITEIVLEVI